MNLSTTGLVLPADAPIDLQTHTVYSDGVWTPEELMDHFVSEGFGLAAITDHDRVDTAASLQQLALSKHFPLLVAAEVSARWNGELTDTLCFGFDPEQTGALGVLTRDIAQRQGENTREMVESLRKKGYTLPDTEVAAVLDTPSAQQPHALVALLKQHGIGTGTPSAGQLVTDAGFAWATRDIADIVDAAHRSGAVCLIAHPGRGDGYTRFDTQLLDTLRRDVPIDGFEVYYPLHTAEQTAMYREYAEKHGLLTSSGSDSHKPDKKPIKYRAELSRRLLERLGIQIAEG